MWDRHGNLQSEWYKEAMTLAGCAFSLRSSEVKRLDSVDMRKDRVTFLLPDTVISVENPRHVVHVRHYTKDWAGYSRGAKQKSELRGHCTFLVFSS